MCFPTGRLNRNSNDFRGYVCPCVLAYNGDFSEVTEQFQDEDVLALHFWETRCSSKRHDLIIYSPKKDAIFRVCTDDAGLLTGCNFFLKSRYCRPEQPFTGNLSHVFE